MTFPNSYNPLETMEKLLPTVANSLGLSSQDVIQMIANELSPETLQHSSLEHMQAFLSRIEQQNTTLYGSPRLIALLRILGVQNHWKFLVSLNKVCVSRGAL